MSIDKHAAVVDCLCREVPGAWVAIFRPLDYVFDECEVCTTRQGKYPHDGCGASLRIEMQELRVAFEHAVDFETMSKIIGQLVALDDRAARMSIGLRREDGSILYGESML